MDIFTEINSSSGANFKSDVKVGEEKLVKTSELEAVKKELEKRAPEEVVSVGSFFFEGTNNYTGLRIKIYSDKYGNIGKVVTGYYDENGTWVDETGIQAAIYGMEYNKTTDAFNDPVPVAYADGSFPKENTFDVERIAPWCDIAPLVIESEVNGAYVEQHLVGVPKFYYTGVQVPANTIIFPGASEVDSRAGFVQIVSSVPLKSFTLWNKITIPEAKIYEEYVEGGDVLDEVYDNMYRVTALKVSDFSLVEGKTPGFSDNNDTTEDYILLSQPITSDTATNIPPRQAELFARKLNKLTNSPSKQYTGGTWQQFYRMKLLFRIEFNTLNSQSVFKGNSYLPDTLAQAGYTYIPPGLLKPFIEKAQASNRTISSGTMNWLAFFTQDDYDINFGYYNPCVYRYHADFLNTPSFLPSNMFVARDPSESNGNLYYWLNTNRDHVLNWTGSNDSTTNLSDYTKYYDKFPINGSSGAFSKNGRITKEKWNKDGIFSIADESSLVTYNGDSDKYKGYGDLAFFYIPDGKLPTTGTRRFSTVALNYAVFGGDSGGVSGIGVQEQSSATWGNTDVYLTSGMSVHFYK